MRSALAVSLALLAACIDPGATEFEPDTSLEGPWLKGNTHAHTTESDGDSSPEYVARWYKDHGYDFLVLTDHNVFTDPATLGDLVDSTFLLVPGEEVTSSFEDASVHVNGLNIPHVIEAQTAADLVATIQANVDAIRAVSGVPHINHPNFRWSFGASEIARVEQNRLLEIWSGHPIVHNEGGGGVPGVEEMWDILLTGGHRIFGLAVDDAHHFQGEFAPDRINPGRGWVDVQSPTLDAVALMEALETGRFYSSTGVELEAVRTRGDIIEVQIAERGDFRYTTEFIVDDGVVRRTTGENPARYELEGDESYVRARITDSMGYRAWTQPVFTRRVQ